MKLKNISSRIGSVGMWILYGCLGAMFIASFGLLISLFVVCIC